MRKINIENSHHTQALLQSLRTSPLLVDHLPEAVCFDRGKFSPLTEIPNQTPNLNYSQKLGHLYEDALEHLLIHSKEMDLIEKNVQIFDDQRITIGELDYILKDLLTDEHIHLELAVKFYLITYKNGEPTYPGPDPRDNWNNKLKRLQQHQLKLSQHPASKQHLLDNYGISQITPQQLIYGKLFDHYRAENHPSPPSINPTCQRGTWKYLSEWERDSAKKQVTIIPKCLWPVSIERDSELLPNLSPITREKFTAEARQRCTMIWDDTSNDTQFIAPDTWG